MFTIRKKYRKLVSADCTMPIGCNVSINNTEQNTNSFLYRRCYGSRIFQRKKIIKSTLKKILMDFKDILEENHIHKIINTFK